MPITRGAHQPHLTCGQLRRPCHAEEVNNQTIHKIKLPDSDRSTLDIRKPKNNSDASKAKLGKKPPVCPAGHSVGLANETQNVAIITIAFRCHLVAKVARRQTNVNFSPCSFFAYGVLTASAFVSAVTSDSSKGLKKPLPLK